MQHNPIPEFEDCEHVIIEANQRNWCTDLVEQLQKDFLLANISLGLNASLNRKEMVAVLIEKVYLLLLEDFDGYLNLLYLIDVPESEFKEVDGADVVVAAEQITFLILKRTYKKVWYKKKYA